MIHYGKLTGGLLVALLAVTPLAMCQPGEVDEPTVCLHCHDDFEAALSQKHVHSPLKSGKCSQCHNPHASEHAALLEHESEELCYQCHAAEKRKHERATVHEPVAKGRCLACHDPHGSAEADQLLAGEKELCASCHGQVEGWFGSSVVHDPVKRGSCTTCHDAHATEEHKLVKQEVFSLCSDCHDIDQRFTAIHKGYDLRGANCAACHDPHASNSQGLLRPLLHAPFADDNCLACHSSLKGKETFALKGKLSDVCFECHDDIQESYKQVYRHVGPEKNECTECHYPHAAGVAPLLRMEQKLLCTGCHSMEGKFAEDLKRSPHRNLKCTTCHTPHGADNARYFKENPVSLCNECHSHEHSVAHPMGEGAVDPRDGSMITCASCHQLHLATHEPLLPYEGERELCVQCHDK
jgi:predicted CXXCH cytochrome family protein